VDKRLDFYCTGCISIETLPISAQQLPQFVCREAGGMDILISKTVVPKVVAVSQQRKVNILVFRSNRCMEKRLKKTTKEAVNDTERTNRNDRGIDSA